MLPGTQANLRQSKRRIYSEGMRVPTTGNEIPKPAPSFQTRRRISFSVDRESLFRINGLFIKVCFFLHNRFEQNRVNTLCARNRQNQGIVVISDAGCSLEHRSISRG